MKEVVLQLQVGGGSRPGSLAAEHGGSDDVLRRGEARRGKGRTGPAASFCLNFAKNNPTTWGHIVGTLELLGMFAGMWSASRSVQSISWLPTCSRAWTPGGESSENPGSQSGVLSSWSSVQIWLPCDVTIVLQKHSETHPLSNYGCLKCIISERKPPLDSE